MKVDMHFHLEEGPHSLKWLSRTLQALAGTEPQLKQELGHYTLAYARENVRLDAQQAASGLHQSCLSPLLCTLYQNFQYTKQCKAKQKPDLTRSGSS